MADETETENTEVETTEVDTEETELDAKALAESVRKLTASLAASREDTKKAKEAAKELEKLKAEKMTETEKAIAEARNETASEVSAKFANRLISERVRSLATGKFAEPQDALMFLKGNGTFDSFKLSDDLEIDDKAITDALNDVAKARPHWLSTISKTASAREAGVGGQSNKNGTKPTNLNDAIAARYANK